ncbi:uncharacterized protein LOC144666254 isoform X2 [Oculina patagonica]
MEGNSTDHGIIPRAIEQVFRTIQHLKEKGWQYVVTANFMELYKNNIKDLLGSGDANTKHEIKLVNPKSTGKACEVTVTNLKTVKVTTYNQVYRLWKKATRNRAVAATKCNEQSSRSHCIFILKLVGEKTDEKFQGTLNLIDLAGFERLTQSFSTGERLDEVKKLNPSLSALGDVVMALAKKERYVPYRNSKLTFLLQNALGGNSKSLMVVNVSPDQTSLLQTLQTLKFATMVNNCQISRY